MSISDMLFYISAVMLTMFVFVAPYITYKGIIEFLKFVEFLEKRSYEEQPKSNDQDQKK